VAAFVGPVEALPLAVPLLALGLALFLIRCYPSVYLWFAFGSWLIIPFLRRVIDEQQEFDPTNPVMLTPYVIGMAALVTVTRHLPRLGSRDLLPWVLVMLGIGYGFIIGSVRAGPFVAIYDLLEWSVPVLLAFHVVMTVRSPGALARFVTRWSVVGLTVLGAYGLFQYFLLPPGTPSGCATCKWPRSGIPNPSRSGSSAR
jgi:hypothetical protein